MQVDVERQLLLGMLALQNGFVSKEKLVAAFALWTLDKSRPLDLLLVETRALEEPLRELLTALVEEHLRQHGNEVVKSLAAISSVADFQHTLQLVRSPELCDAYASIRQGSQSGAGHVDDYATVPRGGNVHDSNKRFVILRPHAQGGLGKVSVALDKELNRHVALKEIHTERSQDPDSQYRFVQEAEITGQLEHPGIVPVYGLGSYGDGRPFYAMRFVEGENLRAGIRSFHQSRSANEAMRGPTAIAFRNLLGRFIDVCQAIEYAHSRHVLHRDLKPDNILLGPYGETLVVDWGLAKSVHLPESVATKGDEATIASRPIQLRSGISSATMEGSAVGTPAYMSPEQAAGSVSNLGPATDIYSLGAILFALLTGKPPVSGATISEVLEKTRRGELDRVQDHWPNAPRALVAICKKALALVPADRYSSAKLLAADIESWLADEPVRAFREPLRDKFARLVRKKPTAFAVGAVLLVALTGMAGVVTWYRSRLAFAAQESAIKSAELQTARHRADEQQLFAQVNSIRERSAKQSPGWSWLNDSELTAAANLSVEKPVDRILREEAARLMLTPDIRQRETGIDGLKISQICWSDDGKLLALGQNTATSLQVSVQLVDAETYETVHTISFTQPIANALTRLETDGVSSLAISPQSRYLFIGTRAGEIHQYDLGTYKPIARWHAHNDRVTGLCVSDDQTVLVSGSQDKLVKWWQLSDKQVVRQLEVTQVKDLRKLGNRFVVGGDDIHSLPLDPKDDEANTVPVIANAGSFTLWSALGIIEVNQNGFRLFTAKGKLVRKLFDISNFYRVDTVSIGCSGKYLVMYDGKNCNVWEYASGKKIATVSTEDCLSIAVDPVRPRWLVADNGRLDCYEIREDPCWRMLPVQSREVIHLEVSTDSQSAFTSWESDDDRGVGIRKWRLEPLELTNETAIPARDETFAVNGASETLLYVDSNTRLLSEIKLGDDSPQALLDGKIDGVHLSYSQDGEQVWLTAIPAHDKKSAFGKLTAWSVLAVDRMSRKTVFQWSNQMQQALQRYSHFSGLSVGRQIFVASTRDNVQIWDQQDRQSPKAIPIGEHVIEKLVLCAGENLAALGTRGGELMLVDTRNAKLLSGAAVHSARISALAAIGDHTFIVGDSMGETSLWQWDGNALKLLARLGPFSNSIEQLLPFDSGQRLAVRVKYEPTVRIVDLARLWNRWRELGLLKEFSLYRPQVEAVKPRQ